MTGNSDLELLSVPMAARELGLHASRVRGLCATGRAGRKIGTEWLLTRAEVERLRADLARDPRSPLHGRQPGGDAGPTTRRKGSRERHPLAGAGFPEGQPGVEAIRGRAL